MICVCVFLFLDIGYIPLKFTKQGGGGKTYMDIMCQYDEYFSVLEKIAANINASK